MTGEPDPPRSDAWWEGYRLGEAHRATGEMACICGDSQEALDKAAGYAAGRGLARAADMNITISVPGGHQAAEITAGPGGGGSVIEVGGGQQQAAQAPARRERQVDAEIDMDVGS